MDVNLTGSIAANLVQPWYIPIVTASAGIIGGLVGAGITLLGVERTQKSNEIINEQNRKHEAHIIQRNERRDAYKRFNIFMERTNMSVGNKNIDKYLTDKFDEDFVQCVSEIELIDFRVASKILEIMPKFEVGKTDPINWWKTFHSDFINEVLPLMIIELNEED